MWQEDGCNAEKNGPLGENLESNDESDNCKASFQSDDFIEPDEPFADDDLVDPGLLETFDKFEHLQVSTSDCYLERDENFELELGSITDGLTEEFHRVSRYEIVDVVGDDKAGRPVVVFYGFRLPSPQVFDYETFLRYVTHILDSFVNQDYSIIYFHYGWNSCNRPPLTWIVRAYRALDRRFKKNLKALYIVHPTRWLRLVWSVFKPIISAKFEKKIFYIKHLYELKQVIHCDQMVIPSEIEDYDRLQRQSFQRHAQPCTQGAMLRTQQFGVTLQLCSRYTHALLLTSMISFSILRNNQNCTLPPIVVDLVQFLRAHGLKVPGVFRKSANLQEVRGWQDRINRGTVVQLDPEKSVHLSAVLLKTFLRELSEPIMTFNLYADLIKLQTHPPSKRTEIAKELVELLPRANYDLLKYLVHFLNEVSAHSSTNLMTLENLALVFAPNLAWPGDQQVTVAQVYELHYFTQVLFINYKRIFSSPP